MENTKKVKFSKGFFTKERPHVDKKESPKDVIPIKWNNEVLEGNKKGIVYIAK